MEGFLLNEELDTVRIATALYKRVLMNEWTGDRDIEVNNFTETLNRIKHENVIEITRLEKFQNWGDGIELEQSVVDDPSWTGQAQENVRMVTRNIQSAMKKCSGLEYKMWEKVKNELGKLDVNKLGYDHSVCSGILDYESKPISMLLPEHRDMFQVALTPRIVASGEWIDSSEKLEAITVQIFEYRAFVHNTMSINETSYMCEVLIQLFDITMSGIPIKCEAWGAWDKWSLVSASRAGDLRRAKRPDYKFTVEISDMGVELIYGETGCPKASQDKQLENHRKLAGLSKDSIEKTRSELKVLLKKLTLSEYLSIFTINVASDTIKIYVMRKECGILVYRPLATAKIPLNVTSSDKVYTLIHTLLTLRTAIIYTLHNILARLDESSEKLLKFAEAKAENTRLKQIIEENVKRDVENTELKSRVGELEARLAIMEHSSVAVNRQSQNDKEAILEILSEVSAVDNSVVQPKQHVPVCKENDNPSNNSTSNFNSVIDQPVHKVIRVPNNNANIKSVKERETDTFLDEVYKKRVSDEIRREKKHKPSTEDLSAPSGASSVTQNEESRLYKKKVAENIVQDIFGFTMDGSEKDHMMKISLTGHEENNCQEKIGSQEDLAELSNSDILQNIYHLYKNACTAENERVKANQAEILCWRSFIIGLDKSVNKIMIKEKNPNTELSSNQDSIIDSSDELPEIEVSASPEKKEYQVLSKKQ
ncbi:44291_t:CDS:10, partial [Gigaspora margarita]